MKIVSIIFTGLLLIPLRHFFILATQLYIGYQSLTEFGVPMSQVNKWEMPYIILFAVYFVSFVVCLFLNAKKKYVAGTALAGSMLLAFVATMVIFGLGWFE
jgi:antibiotic biosynthesis monooxygenase (ABM) superfamily enzyme